MIPKLVFKYRSLTTIDSLTWTIDIIKNNRMYFPERSKLNDPLEGQSINFRPSYAGCSMYELSDLEDPHIKKQLDMYRILSLSSDGFSPQLWAHYGGIYSGICFCFRTDNAFKEIKKVQYITERPTSISMGNDMPEFDNFFFQKQFGWAYESEWRIVQKRSTDSADNYFGYSASDLACIIVGNKMNPTILEILQHYIPKEIPLFRARPGSKTYRIIMLPIDYEYPFDGSEVPSIHDVDGLLRYL